MFERTIEETIAHFRRETIADAPTISSRTILDAPIPPALKRMFEMDFDLLVAEEKKRLTESPRFRYEEQDVLALFDSIAEKARDCAQFSAEEYAAALDRNVKLLFNYVCRPQWTLVKYLFADREHAGTDDIVDALRAFWPYEYFPIILREYFGQKSMTVINVRKFTDLVERIDHEVVRNFDSRKTAQLAEPLFELFNIVSGLEEPTAPVEALSMFYDDKNLSAIVERLDRERATRERLTMHDLVMLVAEADYTIGLDISSIINEQLHMGGLKKERDATAAQDFDVPDISEDVTDGVHHGDLGHEDDALDFVISEEEQGVVMQDHDHATRPLEDDLNDDIEVRDLLIEVEESTSPIDAVEEEETGTVYPFSSATETDAEDVPDDEQFREEGSIDDSILAIENSMEELERYSLSDEGETNVWHASEEEQEGGDDGSGDGHPFDVEEPPSLVLADTDEVPGVTLLDEDDQPTPQFLQSKDEIPDISLDEIDDLDTDEYGRQSDPYDIDETSPLLSASLDDEDRDTTDALQEKASALEEDIDWEKEAENMEDIDIASVDEEERAPLSDAIPGAEDLLQQQEEALPGAEELLSQLDLDDMEEPAPVKEKPASFDIPVVEESLPPVSRQAETETAAEDDVPVEEVLKEFGDLNQLIPDGDKKKYARKLFGKNDEAFTRALQVLNGKPSWRKASEYIDELFIKHDVDMYSRLAVKFTDDIYKRYANKK